MAQENSWSIAEKGPARTPVPLFQRWRKNRLALSLLALFAVVFVLSTVFVGFVYFNSDVTVMEEPMALQNPCDTMYCGYGARCLLDEEAQQAYCECDPICPHIYTPICGDDGNTYSNECEIRLASCSLKKRIAIIRHDECEVQDPCAKKACSFGAKCEYPMSDGSAECICPETCDPAYVELGPRPVCGSDGRNYQNACQLSRASCREVRAIDIKYKGVCDPCDGVECQTFQVCQLDESRNAICRCNTICSPDFKPVCGSDGKTYTNECALRVEVCKTRRNIRIIYTGECSTGSNPCDNLQCMPSQVCDIDRQGTATCQCVDNCESVMRQVCGSDGETYDNECEMRRHACLHKRDLYVAYRGQCGEKGPCFRHHCSSGATCVVKNELLSCECPTCSEEYQPVCGTDGISYTNQCKLKREACEQKSEIAVAYSGVCDGCENKRCEYYAVCESDGRGNGRCVCPQSCIKVDAKVCGSDEVTYNNECEMRVAACRKAQYVMAVSKGACDLCQHVKCKHGGRCEEGRCICPTKCPKTFEPVCANDGVTYNNECKMRQAACKNDQDLTVLFYGECDEVGSGQDMGSGMEDDCHSKSCKYGGECGYDDEGLPTCFCNFHCPMTLEPVCASDGTLYDNDCRIKEQSCHIQKSLMPVHIEMCEEFREVPCDGEIPLVDQSTGKDYFCGDGIGSKLCPPGSYCHKSSAFAKCCSEVILVRTCSDSIFGCCLDGKTLAQGPNYAGCPSVCNCNRLGSYGLTCDPDSKQCSCKPGVGGPRCDRCEPGFWGLHKVTDESSGCSPCACNLYGSVRDDCEQMTGRCVCKHGIQGTKCDICPPGTVLSQHGCMDVSISQPIIGTCEEMTCFYGAECHQDGQLAQCVCDFVCTPDDLPDIVCGSDGSTYASECQMKLFSCRYQKSINVLSRAPCMKSIEARATRGKSNRYIVSDSSPKRFRRHKGNSAMRNPTRNRWSHNDFLERASCFPLCGRTFLQLPERGETIIEETLSLRVKLKFFASSGILFYVEGSDKNATSFLSLTVRNGFIICSFDFGGGRQSMSLKQPVTLGVDHDLLLRIERETVSILLDKRWHAAENRTAGSLERFSWKGFFGYVPLSEARIQRNAGLREGLLGCVDALHYNGVDVIALNSPNLTPKNRKRKVTEKRDSCVKIPKKLSHISGIESLENCLPQCTYNFRNKTFQYKEKITGKRLRTDLSELLRVAVVFRATSSDDLLLSLTAKNNIELRWTLIAGKVSVSITSQNIFAAVCRNPVEVADGRLHTVVVSLTEKFLKVTVDFNARYVKLPNVWASIYRRMSSRDFSTSQLSNITEIHHLSINGIDGTGVSSKRKS